jgi:hypothetical protein
VALYIIDFCDGTMMGGGFAAVYIYRRIALQFTSIGGVSLASLLIALDDDSEDMGSSLGTDD